MRYSILIPAMIALGACNVSSDDNGVTVQYDQNTAENAVADVSNTAENIAADIGNDVKETGEKIDNRVDVDVNADPDASTQNAN